MKQVRQLITEASEHHFEIFGRAACCVRLTLICGHTEIRKLSAIKGYRVNSTKLKCGTCTNEKFQLQNQK